MLVTNTTVTILAGWNSVCQQAMPILMVKTKALPDCISTSANDWGKKG